MDIDHNNTIDETEFTCPQCGSHHWGADLDGGGCHGYFGDGSPCRFSWRNPDGTRYFSPTGRKIPSFATGRGRV